VAAVGQLWFPFSIFCERDKLHQAWKPTFISCMVNEAIIVSDTIGIKVPGFLFSGSAIRFFRNWNRDEEASCKQEIIGCWFDDANVLHSSYLSVAPSIKGPTTLYLLSGQQIGWAESCPPSSASTLRAETRARLQSRERSSAASTQRQSLTAIPPSMLSIPPLSRAVRSRPAVQSLLPKGTTVPMSAASPGVTPEGTQNEEFSDSGRGQFRESSKKAVFSG
jgi:hypothetical protein